MSPALSRSVCRERPLVQKRRIRGKQNGVPRTETSNVLVMSTRSVAAQFNAATKHVMAVRNAVSGFIWKQDF